MPNSLWSVLATPTATEVKAGDGAASDRTDQFVAVTGAESEQVSASAMVLGAYGLFWLIVFAMVAMTYRSQAKLLVRIADLEKRLPRDGVPS